MTLGGEAIETNGNGNGNGRVSLAERLARMETKLDIMIENNRRCQEDHDDLTALGKQVETMDEDIDRLQSKDTLGSIITGVMALIAGAIGWLVK